MRAMTSATRKSSQFETNESKLTVGNYSGLIVSSGNQYISDKSAGNSFRPSSNRILGCSGLKSYWSQQKRPTTSIKRTSTINVTMGG